MTVLGEFALWIALPVAIWGMVLGFTGGYKQRGDLVLSAERSVYGVAFLLFLAAIGIIAAFVGDKYQYWYVAGYSNRALPLFYKVAGLWAGQRGSLLFWALLLSIFASVAVFTNRRKNREFMPWVVGVLQGILTFFLVVLLFAKVNPFQRLGFTPSDGQGLNMQLQNYWMVIHPPMLYLGLTSFSVPFAFGMAALMSGRLDSRWIHLTRRWILLSWMFLSIGIILGMRWAYEELGWGGYWFWDPVENASLLPWLAATAFLHSIQIQENRGMLKVWNVSLVLGTFLLTIFATFLTRSGLIQSVHAFAENTQIAYIFLAFLFTVAAGGVLLILYRLPSLQTENKIESFVSREAAFLFNNLILLGAAFAVFWGTMFPLISQGITGQKISVGPPFFQRVNFPIGLVLLALVGIGPVIAWRRASKRNLKKNFLTPMLLGLVATTVFWILGYRQPVALTTWGVSAFVLTIIVVEFWKGTRARARIEGEGPIVAFYHLVTRNRRRWGGYIVHVGIVMVFLGISGAAYNRDVRQHVEPGDSVRISSPWGKKYTLTYQGLSTSDPEGQRNMEWQAIALVSVKENGKDIGNLTPEKVQFLTAQQPLSRVAIRSTVGGDLYVILTALDNTQGALSGNPNAQGVDLQVLIKPLVGWIWFGGLVLALGSVIAMWPSAERRRFPEEETAEIAVAGASR